MTTPRRAASARPLFVAGCPRSGTTGLASYLNVHPEILVCRERYKYLGPKEITPELFTFERILDFREGETNQPREVHVRLIEAKDRRRLRWVGDKYPHYFKHLRTLAKNNRGARFIVLYRPVEEVAESFAARASNPKDRWPPENGFEAGIELWNASLQHTRRFVEGRWDPRLLIVDYHGFFGDPGSFTPLLSDFLGVEFDERTRTKWETMSREFAARRREKAPLSAEQESLVRETKDHATEDWILDYIERQRHHGGRCLAPLGARLRALLPDQAGVRPRTR